MMTSTFPFHPLLPWGQRATQNATSSTVQTILNRELGFSGFLKQPDNFGNSQTERPTLRQLIYQRLSSLSEQPVDPILMKLNEQGGEDRSINRKRIPNTWIKIANECYQKIFLVGDYLRQTHPQSSPDYDENMRNLEYANAFYKLQDDISLGFKRFSCDAAKGIVLMGEFINIRYLENNSSGLLYATLTANGVIRFYDISHSKKLKSPRILTLPNYEKLRCTDLYVDYIKANLYVLGTLNGTVKRIFKISYPSLEVESKKLIYNRDKLGPTVKMVIEQSVVLITTNTEVYLGNINDYFLPGHPDDLEIPILPNLGTLIKTTDHYFSLIDTIWPPVSITLSNPEKHKTRFHLTSMHDGREIWAKTFGAHDVCILNPVMADNEYALVLQKFNDTHSIIHIKKDSSDPPTYHAKEETDHDLLKSSLENSLTAHRVSSRPLRKCTLENLANQRRRDSLIAMDYCNVLDLIGVCILESGVLVVSLYEARTHKIFKRLPSLKVREFRSKRRVFSEDDDLSLTAMSIDFEIDTDIIFITIEYFNKKEYYCLNLLGDDASLTL